MIQLKQKVIMIFLTGSLLLSHALEAESSFVTVVLNNNIHNFGVMYAIGDRGPEGGKVYYVDDSGQHGLEAKPADEIDLLSWSDAVKTTVALGSGWRLPTKTELKVLYERRKIVGGFAKDDYWSSTELDVNSAWIQGFWNGDQDRYNKHSKLSVRAVRAF